MRTVLLAIGALLTGAAILLTGNGLQAMLIPVRGALEQFSTSAIGLFSTAYAVGYVFSCFITPVIVRRVGHIRAFAVLAAIAASVILLMGLIIHPLFWILLRVVSGFCLAGLFMVIESWLNEKSSNANRGQIFSIYMVVNLSAVTLGQMLLPVGNPSDHVLFVVTGIAILLALVPLSLSTAAAPQPIAQVRLRLGRLYRMSPVGLLGCFFVGLTNGAYGGLGAVFAYRLGFSVTEIALFMSASLIGGALAQFPIGRLSDRMDRRRVIIGVCLFAAIIAIVLGLAGGVGNSGNDALLPPFALIAISAVFGCFIYTMYSLCVAHTNDFIAAEDFVEASSGLLLTYGIGAIIGPVIASLLMQNLGAGMLFIYTASVHILFLLFTLWRITRRAAPLAEERSHFVQNESTRTTPAAAAMDPRAQKH